MVSGLTNRNHIPISCCGGYSRRKVMYPVSHYRSNLRVIWEILLWKKIGKLYKRQIRAFRKISESNS